VNVSDSESGKTMLKLILRPLEPSIGSKMGVAVRGKARSVVMRV